NPELTGPITPVGSGGYTIQLPEGSSDIVAMNEDSLYTVRYTKITTYTVRRGDSIQRIAKFYRVNADEIVFLNQLPRPYFLKIGRPLYIPRT
ncbi:MAG TPA: LysM domain-containing protein, partial [Spirochaetota bacterium]